MSMIKPKNDSSSEKHFGFLELRREFTDLVRDLARRCARHYRLDPDDAEQEAWIRIHREFEIGRHDPRRGEVGAWITVATRSAFQDARKREARSLKFREVILDLEGWSDIPDSSDSRRVSDAAEELVSRVLKELRTRVSESTCRVVELYWLDGLSDDQIADELGISPRNTRVLRSRGMKVLRSIGDSSSA